MVQQQQQLPGTAAKAAAAVEASATAGVVEAAEAETSAAMSRISLCRQDVAMDLLNQVGNVVTQQKQFGY